MHTLCRTLAAPPWHLRPQVLGYDVERRCWEALRALACSPWFQAHRLSLPASLASAPRSLASRTKIHPEMKDAPYNLCQAPNRTGRSNMRSYGGSGSRSWTRRSPAARRLIGTAPSVRALGPSNALKGVDPVGGWRRSESALAAYGALQKTNDNPLRVQAPTRESCSRSTSAECTDRCGAVPGCAAPRGGGAETSSRQDEVRQPVALRDTSSDGSVERTV